MIRLVGMMLVVYVQTKHEKQVYDAEAEHNGTGIMGMMVSNLFLLYLFSEKPIKHKTLF